MKHPFEGHTKGPLEWSEEDEGGIVLDDGECVFLKTQNNETVMAWGDIHAEGNPVFLCFPNPIDAKLFRAAPDLLAALVRLVEAKERLGKSALANDIAVTAYSGEAGIAWEELKQALADAKTLLTTDE